MLEESQGLMEHPAQKGGPQAMAQPFPKAQHPITPKRSERGAEPHEEQESQQENEEQVLILPSDCLIHHQLHVEGGKERQSLKQKGGKEQHEQGPGQLGPKHGPEGRQERPKPGDHPRRRPLLQRRFQLQRVAREVLLKGRIG